MNAGFFIMFSAIDLIMARVAGNVLISGVGIVQSVGVILRHRGHSKGFRGIVPVRRWSVGLPMRDMTRSIILLRVLSNLFIASISAEVV